MYLELFSRRRRLSDDDKEVQGFTASRDAARPAPYRDHGQKNRIREKRGMENKKKKRKEKERRPESDDGRKRGEIVGTRGNSVANRT